MIMLIHRAFVICGFALLAIAAPAQQVTIDLSAADRIARGAVVFGGSCAVGYCHGSEGRAARGPQLREREWQPQKLYDITRDGIPDTSMPAWKGLLPDADIWATVAYVMSLSTNPPAGEAAIISTHPSEESVAMQRDEIEQLGYELFFDPANVARCSICHRLGGVGAAIGPDLAVSARQKSFSALVVDIVAPQEELASGFEQVVVNTKHAEQITGMLKDKSENYIRVYDTSSMPPPLRTFYRDEVASLGSAYESSMPRMYGKMLGRDNVVAIVTFLKSGKY